MPTRTQRDITTVGQALSARELETLWEDFAEDRLAGDPPPNEQSIAHTERERICDAIEFDAARESPGEARRKVVMALRRRGCGEAPIQDAALLVTELAANAVVHASSSFSVSVSLLDSTLRVDVADGRPIAADRAGRATQEWIPRQGHGLGLIDAICSRWGSDITAEGKVVWGELQLDAEGDRGEAPGDPT